MQQLAHGAKREMLLPTCARVSRGETQRERDKESRSVTVCRFFNVHTYTCASGRRRWRENPRYGWISAFRGRSVIKRNLARGWNFAAYAREGRLKRNRSPPPSVTGLTPVFSTPFSPRRSHECEWYSNGPLADRDGERMGRVSLVIENELCYIRARRERESCNHFVLLLLSDRCEMKQ